MTSTTPRPMPTPDLAGLLAKPARKPTTAPAKIIPASDVASTPEDDPGAEETPLPADPAAAVIEESTPATTPAKKQSAAAAQSRPPVKPATQHGTTAPFIKDPGTAQSGRQYLRTIALYLPRSVHRDLGIRAEQTGTTRTALILTAVNEHHRDVADALQAPTNPVTGNDLFDIPQQRADKEPSVHTTIRVTDRQFAAIDSLVDRLETNRSALITAAVRLHLGSSTSN